MQRVFLSNAISSFTVLKRVSVCLCLCLSACMCVYIVVPIWANNRKQASKSYEIRFFFFFFKTYNGNKNKSLCVYRFTSSFFWLLLYVRLFLVSNGYEIRWLRSTTYAILVGQRNSSAHVCVCACVYDLYGSKATFSRFHFYYSIFFLLFLRFRFI